MESDSDKLLEVLEALDPKDFKKFKWLLQQPKFSDISKSKLGDDTDILDTVDLLTQTYPKSSVDVVKRVLFRMKKNHLVQRLSEGKS